MRSSAEQLPRYTKLVGKLFGPDGRLYRSRHLFYLLSNTEQYSYGSFIFATQTVCSKSLSSLFKSCHFMSSGTNPCQRFIASLTLRSIFSPANIMIIIASFQNYALTILPPRASRVLYLEVNICRILLRVPFPTQAARGLKSPARKRHNGSPRPRHLPWTNSPAYSRLFWSLQY